MKVDVVKIVKFSLDFIQERQLLEDREISALARSAERNLSKHDTEKWLKTLKAKIGAPMYSELKRKFYELYSDEDGAKQSSSSATTNSKIRFAQAKFALDFVREEGLLTEEVVGLFTTHAESITSKADLDEWMNFLKDKVGPAKKNEMVKAYTEFTKKDCGFERTTQSEIVRMLEKFKSAV